MEVNGQLNVPDHFNPDGSFPGNHENIRNMILKYQFEMLEYASWGQFAHTKVWDEEKTTGHKHNRKLVVQDWSNKLKVKNPAAKWVSFGLFSVKHKKRKGTESEVVHP